MKTNPIPTRDRVEFFAYMADQEVGVETSDDGHWKLLDAAEEYMIKKRYAYGDPHSAVQQYLKQKT